jgi:hypothetical protein
MRIGAHAFAGSSLSSITIPASVEHLEKGCFKYCSGLVSVTFEGGSRLQSLGEWAFAYSQLSSILLPAGVEVIPQCCFANCLSLTSVSFGASSQLTTIEERAFGGCRVLRVVGIPKDTWVMGSVDFTIYRLPPATVTSMMDS